MIRLIGRIFAIIGALLLIVAALLYFRAATFETDALHASGTVIDLVPVRSDDGGSPTYAAHIQFVTDTGHQIDFVESGSSNPPRYGPGDRVELLYDPQAPQKALVDDFEGQYLATTICGLIGVVFAIVGGAILVAMARSQRRRARLLSTGTPIEAEFLHVYRDDRISMNGAHPFRVVAQAPDSQRGALRHFESAPLWVDPTDQLEGRKVRIWIDPSKPGDYVVDLREIVDART